MTITVEKSYQWRLSRTAEKGIPDLEEAIGVYSSLNPESLKQEMPTLDNFPGGRFRFSPQYPLAKAIPALFFSQCVQNLGFGDRLDTIRWELVCLANKVLVADKCDASHQETRQQGNAKSAWVCEYRARTWGIGGPAKRSRLVASIVDAVLISSWL